MKYKKGLIFICLIFGLFSIACVCASDVNVTIGVDVGQNSEFLSVEDTTDINLIGNCDDNKLNANKKSFSDLNTTINDNNDSNVYLNDNYEFISYKDKNLKEGIVVNRDLNVWGNGFTIDGARSARIFNVVGGNVVFHDIVFINGKTGGNGCAILGKCTVINSNFTKNTAEFGGAMYQGSAVNCTFSNNSAPKGGAMYQGSAVNCTFNGNQAVLGGAKMGFSAVNCTFIKNTADIGGAVFSVSAMNCRFIENTAREYAGAMTGNSAVNCTFIRNTANSRGGAIEDSTAVNCTFIENTANVGGAMFGVNYTATNCNFTNNTAKKEGGATYKIIANNCSFYDNNASENGGAMYGGVANDCIFSNNKAGISGDDIYDTIVSKPILIVYNFTSIYNSGDKLLFNLTYMSGLPIRNANITIRIYKNDKIIGTYYALSGEGWIVNVDVGSYIAVCSIENQAYDVEPVNATISINRANSTVNVSDVVMNYGESKNVTVIAEGATEITALVDGTSVDVVNNYTISISNLSAGNHTLTVTTMPDGNHESVTKTANITVNKASTKIILTNETLNLNILDEITAGATLAPADAGNLTFTASNSSVVKVEDGKIIAIGEGTVIITVSFAGSDDYAAAENKTIEVTVSKMPTEIIINVTSLDLFVGDEIVIVANLTPADAGNVTFTSSNESVVEFDDQGIVIAQGKGQAIITVSFAGNNNYAAAENRTVTVTVNLDEASVAVDKNTLDLKVGETYAINATKHPDTILLDVTYTSSNSSVVTVDEKGIVTAVGEGIAVITVEVGDDEIYAKNSTNVTVTVSKVPTEIGAKPITATYNVNKNLVITLKDSNGKALGGVKVTVDLNGAKTYTTDSNGQIKVATKSLAPKTYTAKIAFNGDDKYINSTKDVKVTVKKATPKLTAKKKTYKTTTKIKKYIVVLKDNVGKAIKKVKVTLKVKGKTYKVKTNAKGKVTFKIKNLKKKGKYNAVVTYKGNKYYNKVTKKTKIIIK